jgi:hypothetical protein
MVNKMEFIECPICKKDINYHADYELKICFASIIEENNKLQKQKESLVPFILRFIHIYTHLDSGDDLDTEVIKLLDLYDCALEPDKLIFNLLNNI